MDFWQRARNFAEEAAKRSQELTNGISPSKLSDVVSEASKRSKEIAAEASKKSMEIAAEASKKSMEIAAEASKKSMEIAAEAMKRADQITFQLPPAAVALSSLVDTGSPASAPPEVSDADLERFGVTDELREFVQSITKNTFRDFPLEDDSEVSDIPAVSNVRQDLTEWQENHAKLVLATVKEIKSLRYELCPRIMKERKFWRIYFILVNSHVDPYEKRYMEEKLKTAEKQENASLEISPAGTTSGAALGGAHQKSKSASSEQDLDVFLLGDTGDSDEGPDDGDDGFDDDFDKI